MGSIPISRSFKKANTLKIILWGDLLIQTAITFTSMIFVMRKCLFLLLVLLPLHHIQANIDSLLHVLSLSPEDTAKVRLLRTLGWKYNLRDADSSLMFYRQSYELSEKLNFYPGEIMGLLGVGSGLSRKGMLKEYLINIRKALAIAISKKDDLYLGMCYNRLGSYYHNVEYLPDSSIYYFNLSITHQKKLPDQYNLWNTYFSRGELYYKMGMVEKGQADLEKALEITSNKKIRMDYGVVLFRLIRNAFDMGDWNQYSDLTESYIKFLDEGNKSRDISSTYHRGLYFFEDEARPDSVIPVIKKMLGFHEKQGNYSALVDAYEYLAGVQFRAGKISDAIETQKRTIELAEKYGKLVSAEVGYRELARMYEANGNLSKALETYKKYHIMHDSVEHINNYEYINELEIKYETDKKEEALLRQGLALEKNKLANRNFQLLILLLVLAVVGVSVFLLIKNRSNKVLASKNSIITHALQEKELLLREIHHRVKNNLQVISSLLNLQSKYVQDASAAQAIKEGRNRVNSMSLIHQNLYMQDNLATMDVSIYLQKLSQSLFQSYNIETDRIQLITQVDPVELDIDMLIPLGLILNELISNALKHAFPDDRNGVVKVILKKEEEQLVLEVTDNGVGMKDGYGKQKNNSFGMEMVEAFAQKLKATLTTENFPGVSTRLVIPNKAA